ncbi:DUF885 domain-containing protein [Shewanella oneidensis MR-1]|uniref:DUF885 domain-containing protein n=1 Tax=Shewanella oneidensis (strain ATCC 700550 / JCM 31522 / CIP 106686 / LMG 19005 / NCIMB 14063 / MR-1) TaxID=211586 RepID=Q8EFY3_SHEON|nr:DUF885 domain-containing protein [Shewanella oneidensis]AAN54883.1 putative outer membrane lipoprotein of unknown function DUF885 [Shewanella oneidensis MR-1]MDX5996394.1 DUF885 domain-containing protein [Shewanella oneidensis]MEE2028657.1 hypothetical protein [Shewanella oneidensis]QKG96496.1 DUF885 domain-containing protein [Shewanella oneidensis MR-1]
MKLSLLAGTLALALALQGCSKPETNVVAQDGSTSAAAAQVETQTAESRYLALVDGYFKDYLKLEPIYATFVGVNDYNTQFGGDLTEEYLKARHDLNTRYLAQVKTIDLDELPADLQLSYSLFVYDREMALVDETYPSRFMPISQFYSTVITMVQLGSGESAQPFNTVQDYRNWEQRVNGFIDWIKLAQHRMDEGIASKVVLPRVLVERIIPQLDAMLTTDASQSIFYSPITHFPEGFSAQDKAELTASYQAMISERLVPTLTGLRDYFKQTYLPKSRATDGWSGLPNGKAWYQHLANSHTTTTMPVDEIHQIGLSEVARILSEMDKVREQVGFKGDLKAFFASLSSEPQYFYSDRQGLIDGYMALKDKINLVLPQYFNVMPKADYVVKPVESFREQSAAGASYEAPAVDGSRPGVFYINTYNLKAQPKWGMTTLSLHEAAPGHHFQIAIKQELTGVPEFQRFSGYTAFEEGWALYAEYLGIEMGLFSDPYQYFGKLSDEMLRAMRLVVDTGLHAKGWSREQAIQYMKDNSPMAESDIVAEVERYMAIPGQALSYKVGQLKILALRERAEKALGDKFDLKAFHDQILTSGSLPMAVMEQKIDRWIAANKA